MVIETERLILREYTPEDFDALYEIMSDPETMQHYPKPFGEERTKGWIEWNLKNYKEYGFGQNNAFAAFMNLCNLNYMFDGISSEFEIGNFNIMEEYNPHCLEANVQLFDKCLQKYGEVYKSTGIEVKRFSDVNEFVIDYLDK